MFISQYKNLEVISYNTAVEARIYKDRAFERMKESMAIQLGWKAGPEQYPPNELLGYAIAAEQAGFESIDVSDHFHPWSEVGQAAFTWTWLGAVAAQTKRIHMGPGVTCPILRYHP